MRARDAVDLVLLGALWGAAFLFMRVAVPEFGPLPTMGLRTAIAALVLMPLLAARGGLGALRRHAAPIALVGLTNSAMPFALFGYALLTLSAGVGSVLNATAPMFAALIARGWLGERLNATRWSGLVVGFAGVAILVSEKATVGASGSVLAVGLCLAASLLYGASAGFARHRLAGVDSFATAAGSQASAALGLAPFAIAAWPDRLPGPAAWLAVAALGVACTALAYILYFRLIERLGPTRAITVTFLVPVFGVGFGAIFLGERISPTMIVGSFVVVLGTALVTGVLSLPGRRARSS
jgi:drug/metabolite transporter (DMT)-like permease